jgi:flagellar biosynthesis protein FlhG
MDQAESLRKYMQRFNVQHQNNHSSRVITITSGKAGVGKSNFILNFALGLKASGKKVVILDLDLSTANINILMGVTPSFSLVDILFQRKYIWDILGEGMEGIEFISGGLDLQNLLELDQETLSFFLSQIQDLHTYADFILIDTSAGISKALVDVILASDDTILVTTPEPASITDSYAVLKTVLQSSKQSPNVRLLVNRAKTYRDAVEASRAIKNTSNNFLKYKLKTLGFLMEDVDVQHSVKLKKPHFIAYPNSETSKEIKQMVSSFLLEMEEVSSVSTNGIRGFFEKIMIFDKSL